MKTWVLGAAGCSVIVALMACSVSTSTGGVGAGTTSGNHGGGSTTHTVSTGTGASTTSTNSNSSTSSTATGDPCASGADCTQCADFQSCYDCNKTLYPQGEALFNTLVNCVFCQACYTVCEGSMNGCTMAPTTKDPCDMGTPSMPGTGTTCGDANGGCVKCAQVTGGSCNSANAACGNSADCKSFDTALQACPTN